MSVALPPLPGQSAPYGPSGGFTSGGLPALPSVPASGARSNVPEPTSTTTKAPGWAAPINAAIDGAQSAQKAVSAGAPVGQAWGESIGSFVGGGLGALGGQAVGASAGAAVGGAVGSAVPVAGTTAGAVTGAGVGRAVGGVVGQQVGQELGGMLGGAIGGLFDAPRPTSTPVTNPATPPAFSGGQCANVEYRITWNGYVLSGGNPTGSPLADQVHRRKGPISLTQGPPTVGYFYYAGSPAIKYFEAMGSNVNAQNRFVLTKFQVQRWDGGVDTCGDPPGAPDYYTPPGARPTPDVYAPLPDIPTIPGRPGGKEPVPPGGPGGPGGDGGDGIGEPAAPTVPDKPGGKEPVPPGGGGNQPNPDGSPGTDDPTPPSPQPPEAESCDPCDKIDALQKKLEDLFNQNGAGAIALGDCEEPEPEPAPDPATGGATSGGGVTTTPSTITPSKKTPSKINGKTRNPEPFEAAGDIEAEDDGSLSWTGDGLAGLYNAAIAISRAIGVLNNKIACQTEGDSPVIIYPNDVYSEFTLEGRLTLEFTTLDAYPKQVTGNSRWSLDIPNPKAEYDWVQDFESFRLNKGSWYGRCIWSDSGVRSGAYCANHAEAQKLIDFVAGLTTSLPKRQRITSSGRTGLSTAQVRIIRAVKATIVGGQVTETVCYKPPTTQP